MIKPSSSSDEGIELFAQSNFQTPSIDVGDIELLAQNNGQYSFAECITFVIAGGCLL